MTTDELARVLSEHAHEIAWQQRYEFQRETRRQEAERAERERKQAGSLTHPTSAQVQAPKSRGARGPAFPEQAD